MSALADDHQGPSRTEQAALHVQQVLARSIEAGGVIRPAHETLVRNALDRLRASPSDPALLARFETMSCMLARMSIYQRDGRVNAYASALRQLWSTARLH